jgi:hypothetical protein
MIFFFSDQSTEHNRNKVKTKRIYIDCGCIESFSTKSNKGMRIKDINGKEQLNLLNEAILRGMCVQYSVNQDV